MAAGTTYPFVKFRFRMIVNGFTAGFSEVSGFDATTDVIEYRAGSDTNNSTIKLPGLTKYSNITLKWGMTDDMTLYNWMTSVIGGSAAINGTEVEREDITIELLGEDGQTVKASWQVRQAWPCKYTAPDFNANSSELAIESLELAHEGITRLS